MYVYTLYIHTLNLRESKYRDCPVGHKNVSTNTVQVHVLIVKCN